MKVKLHYQKYFFFIMMFVSTETLCQTTPKKKDEVYRPTIHFSPKTNWTNDPNGMVYHNGVYHLFYQHHPFSSVWGPMHWGHATTKDLINWKHEPIAIYPDSIGTIFSGSVVFDKTNTSGLGKNGQAPLVAIFTQHNIDGEKAGKNNFQTQSIAFSNDNGSTWEKYEGNPVLHNPGIVAFRDPKVMWYEPHKKWIMSLSTNDRITFYSSKNLKSWVKESDFGATIGAHGGVWECPDLITLDNNGKKEWALIVSVNPGGPNKGSATQYFIGDFDGNKFTPHTTNTKWIDYGPDNYAGITWANTGNRKIFLGWMSNWLYANVVPTETWRNAMTIPRELKIKLVENDKYITSEPVSELLKLQSKPIVISNLEVNNSADLSTKIGELKSPFQIKLNLEEKNDFSFTFYNDIGEEIIIGFDKKENNYFIDRRKSGKIEFQNEFADRHTAPRFTNNPTMNITLIFDVSSVELFADEGLTVMTAIYFPNKPYSKFKIHTNEKISIKRVEYIKINSNLK